MVSSREAFSLESVYCAAILGTQVVMIRLPEAVATPAGCHHPTETEALPSIVTPLKIDTTIT
jgi:hypothetical protein